MTTTICKGVVQKNNVVLLENGAALPEGAEVEVRFFQPDPDRDAAFRQILENPIRRFVGIDEIIEDDKREREERHGL
jgi:hypothetical protein